MYMKTNVLQQRTAIACCEKHCVLLTA